MNKLGFFAVGFDLGPLSPRQGWREVRERLGGWYLKVGVGGGGQRGQVFVT